MEKIYEAMVYRQQTVVSERKETNKVSPTIAQAHCFARISGHGISRGNPSGAKWTP